MSPFASTVMFGLHSMPEHCKFRLNVETNVAFLDHDVARLEISWHILAVMPACLPPTHVATTHHDDPSVVPCPRNARTPNQVLMWGIASSRLSNLPRSRSTVVAHPPSPWCFPLRDTALASSVIRVAVKPASLVGGGVVVIGGFV